MKTLINLFLIFVAFSLNGCGGGGGSGSGSAATKVTNLNLDYQKNVVSNYATGDLNGDGLEDIVIGGWTGKGTSYLTILIQNTDGTLTDRTIELAGSNQYPASGHIFIGDFDNDGYADIWLPGGDDWLASSSSLMLWGSASGKFTRQVIDAGIASHGGCIADLNGDGYQDLLIQGTYNQNVETSGYYLNNKNRTFSNIVPNSKMSGASACAVIVNNSNGHFAFFQAGTNQLEGYRDTISIVDSNLQLIKQIGVTTPSSPANLAGITGAVAVDINGDGLLDFVISYESFAYNGTARKDVWLNLGNDNFEFGFTIDNFPVALGIQSFEYNGIRYINFIGGNLDNEFYQVINGKFISYKKDRLLYLAQSVGGDKNATAGKSSIWSSVIYKGKDGLYILEDLRPIGLYTLKL